MKNACERCGSPLVPAGEAYACSYECTFCLPCAVGSRYVCSHCGGELVRRPRREVKVVDTPRTQKTSLDRVRPLLVWAISFGGWGLVTLAATFSLGEFYRDMSGQMSFLQVLGMEASQVLPYALMTPFVFMLAVRFPIQKQNWISRGFLYLLGGLVFCLVHVFLRGLTPYAIFDPQRREWVSAFWDASAHMFHARWHGIAAMYKASVVDDVWSAYGPILVVAQAFSYYRGLRAKESQAVQLEAQLAKARLQSLKSQLQPHFLFNTLHSISALMLSNPPAADRMMTRLSELLRMTLENEGVQLTTLARELEFVNGYLEIEKIRFADKLTVFIEVPPDLLDAPVPQLLLQPLAENAVRHGIARQSQPGWVRISASYDPDSELLQICVKDNGVGLTESASDASKGGKGLGTTKERLATLYGRGHSFEIRNAPEGGVEVLVRIPYVPSLPNPELAAEQGETTLQGEREWVRKPSGP